MKRYFTEEDIHMARKHCEDTQYHMSPENFILKQE